MLSIPTSFDLMLHFLKSSNPIYLPKDEIVALSFLKKQPRGVVLSQLYKQEREYYQNQIPINQIEDSSYIAAFSGKQQYIAEFQTLSVSSVPFEERLKRVNVKDCSILKEVDYVYEIKTLPQSRRLIAKCFSNKAKKIFENKLVTIYSLTKSF